MLTGLILASIVGALPEVSSRPPIVADQVWCAAQAAADRPPDTKKKKKKKGGKKDGDAGGDQPPPVPAPDDTSEEARAQDDTPAGGIALTWKQHPGVRIGSVLRVDFQAKFQEDVRATYGGASDLDTWDLHRSRVGIQGRAFRHVEFEIERELTEKELDAGKLPKSPWKDVNVNVTYLRNAQVQVGKFKLPFGRDQLTSVTHNDFIYRSLGASYLAPARDVGAMVHGSFLRHGLEYAAGAFRHDGDNARSRQIAGGDETFAGRVTGTPFRPINPLLGEIEIGSAFTVSRLSDDSFRPNGLRGRSVLTQDVFFEPVYVNGQRRRWEADLNWNAGPASVRAEYTRVADQRRQQGLGNQDLPAARARSWYVSGTWILTGEDKKRPVKPEADFLQGGIGAVELAGRYERLWFGSERGVDPAFRNPRAETILQNGDRVFTVGVNWTLNRFVKLQFNTIREHIEDAERNPVPNGAAFWSRVMRFQFVL
jgi:phosphate-selective porin OprO and OprP